MNWTLPLLTCLGALRSDTKVSYAHGQADGLLGSNLCPIEP